MSETIERSSMSRRVFVAGVFDVFHVGHLNLLERAAARGQELHVGALTDDAAAANKPRPIIPFEHRARMAALRCVTRTYEQEASDATYLLKEIGPDVLVHGDDHTPSWEIGQTWMRARGGQFVLLPYTPGVSTTWIRNRLCGAEQGAGAQR